MKILLLSATQMEIAPLLSEIAERTDKSIDVLIGGIGTASTIYHLSRILRQNTYNLVIQAGIAGSFTNQHPLCTVVQVREDCFGNLGAEQGNQFLSARQLGFLSHPGGVFMEQGIATNKAPEHSEIVPFTGEFLINPAPTLAGIASVRGVSVETVSGKEATIKRLLAAYAPEIETMESAACFYTCLMMKQNFHVVRSISNIVGPRNKDTWKTQEAIHALCEQLVKIIRSL